MLQSKIIKDETVMRFVDVLIVCLVFVLTLMILGPKVLRVYARKKANPITPIALAEKIKCTKDIVLLDVRKKKTFNSFLGHIEDSVNVPFAHLAKSLTNKELEDLRDVPLVIIDEADSLVGLKVYKMLKERGFLEVYLLEGGFLMWVKNRLPTVKGE